MMAETTGSGAGNVSGVRCVIVTPELTSLDTRARFVTLPLFDGQRGVGRGHAPFIGRLGAGEVQRVGAAPARLIAPRSGGHPPVDPRRALPLGRRRAAP